MNPVTLEEWAAYIDTLDGDSLRSKAMAANSLEFVRNLEDEGTAPRTTMKILRLFAARFKAVGQEPPGRYAGALVDYGQLIPQ
jgi:hypothetical protein